MNTTRQVTGPFTALVPAGWFHKENIQLLAPDGQANVITSSEPIDPTLTSAQYAAAQGDLLRKEFPGYIEHRLERAPVLGAGDGFVREFSWRPPDQKVPVRQTQLYMAHKGRGYTATATASGVGYDSYEQALQEILTGIVARV